MLKQITASGNNYQCGLALGRTLAKETRQRLNLLKITPQRLARHRSQLTIVHQLCENHYPQYLQELRGMADGAQVDYWLLFFLNCPDLNLGRHGCSSIAINKADQLLLAHNEDNEPYEQKDFCTLAHLTINGHTMHAFYYAGELIGGAFGWNQHGLATTINYVRALEQNPIAMSKYFTARALLDTTDPQQALETIKNIPNASGYHYYLANHEQILSVEHTPTHVSSQRVQSVDFHTNHYLHPDLTQKVPASKHSLTRLRRIQDMLSQNILPLEILFDCQNRPNSCLLYTSPSPRDRTRSRMPSSA